MPSTFATPKNQKENPVGTPSTLNALFTSKYQTTGATIPHFKMAIYNLEIKRKNNKDEIGSEFTNGPYRSNVLTNMSMGLR